MSLSKRQSRLHHSRLRVELLESRLQPGSLLPAWGTMGGMAADLAALESYSTRSHLRFDSLYSETAQDHWLLDLAASADSYSSTPVATAVSSVTLVQSSGFQQTASSLPTVAAAAAATQQTVQLMTVANASPTLVSQPVQTGAKNALPVQAQALAVTQTLDVSSRLHTADITLKRIDINSSGATPPTLIYSSFLGGEGEDGLNGMARDASGNLYVSGYRDISGKITAIVAQLDAAATTVNWAIAVENANPGRDEFAGMALSADGSILYVVGSVDNGSGDPN